MTSKLMRPGDPHYRAYVGPPAQYDFMGLTQISLLCSTGLREFHKLLDVGCGSLRAGRLLIPFLDRGNYCGIEPNKWLVEDGVQENLGTEIITMKQPRFDYNATFDCTVFGESFDYVVAQSIFSHTKIDMARRGIDAVAGAIKPDGLFLATFVLPRPGSVKADPPGDEWVYPGLVEIEEATIARLFENAGFSSWRLPWFHPRQVWFAASPAANRLSADDVAGLAGYVVGSEALRRR